MEKEVEQQGQGSGLDSGMVGGFEATDKPMPGKLLALDSAGKVPSGGLPGGGMGYLFHAQDEKSSGTGGGSSTAGSWELRTVNTVKTNEISGASLASSQITLPVGTYYIDASAPASSATVHRLKLYNASDAADVLLGTSEYGAIATATQTRSHVSGRFTLTATKLLELRHRVANSSAGNGYGVQSSLGTEIYTVIKIWKVG